MSRAISRYAPCQARRTRDDDRLDPDPPDRFDPDALDNDEPQPEPGDFWFDADSDEP